MAYEIISQNNTTTTLSDGTNTITVPARVTLATSTSYTISEVNNNTATLEGSDGSVIRDVPCVVVLAGESGGGSDVHNKGYFATQAALEEAYPTGEAGDYAIVGATDTVWIWDEDSSAWVDTDTKGQVTSVNGQTGAVTLTIPAEIQVSTMPTAGADELGKVYQFIGTTDANYTNGYFYKCVSDGQDPATYSWTQTDVQPAPSGLPDQTGQSGKFLTTDGTDASWATINALQNTATGSDALTILGNPTTTYRGINIGYNSTTSGNSSGIAIGSTATASNSVVGSNGNISIGASSKSTSYYESIAIGAYAESSSNYGIALGKSANCKSSNTISIGYYANCGTNSDSAISIGYSATSSAQSAISIGYATTSSAQKAIQLGYGGTNSDANTFKVSNANGNFEIMSADGTIPEARLADTTNATTGDVLQLDSNGNAVWAASGGGGSSLPSQTGNSGKFLTTDGTNASWSSEPLTNKYNPAYGIFVLGSGTSGSNTIAFGAQMASGSSDGVAIGWGASLSAANSVLIGKQASCNKIESTVCGYKASSTAFYATSIGGESSVSANGGTALGYKSHVTASYAIQLGYGTNSEANTLYAGWFYQDNAVNYKLLDSNGTIPADRFASTTGLADGNYRLRLTMSNGTPTLSWVAE